MCKALPDNHYFQNKNIKKNLRSENPFNFPISFKNNFFSKNWNQWTKLPEKNSWEFRGIFFKIKTWGKNLKNQFASLTQNGPSWKHYFRWKFSSRISQKCGSVRIIQSMFLSVSIWRYFSPCFFRHLDVKLGKCSAYQKTNKETVVEIQESVRGKNVYIIQTGTK